nr:restriction endonuclease subunit S [uncultured Lachnoanaerobaculum sp.]
MYWEQRKLGELGTVITGNTPATVVKDYYTDDNEDGIVWVTPTDIVTNITSETEKRLTDLGQKVGRIVPANTILVTCIASIGKNTMLIDRGSFNQQINALIPNENKYEPYFLLTESFIWSHKMKTSASTGTMQIVNRMEFSEINTNVPNKNEQKSIGILFRTLDHLITLHQSKSFECFFFDAACCTLSWEQRKLGEVVEIYDGVHQTPNYTDNGIMFLSVENITKLKSSKFISEEAFKRDYKFYPQENDILMTRIGDVGTTNVVTDNSLKAYYVSLALLKYKSTNPFFLSSAIQSDFVQSGLANRTLKTAIPIKINKDEIGKVNVMLPLLKDEQELIGYCFHNLDHLITLHQLEPYYRIFKAIAYRIIDYAEYKFFNVKINLIYDIIRINIA